MNKIIFVISLVTGIAAIVFMLIPVFLGNVSTDWPVMAAMACVAAGCVITLVRTKKKL